MKLAVTEERTATAESVNQTLERWTQDVDRTAEQRISRVREYVTM